MEKTNPAVPWGRMLRVAFPATVPVMTGFLVLGFVIAGSQALMKHLNNKKKEGAK